MLPIRLLNRAISQDPRHRTRGRGKGEGAHRLNSTWLRSRQFLSGFLLAFSYLCCATAAEPALRDTMDGDAPVMRLDGDSDFKLLDQRIDRNALGNGAEVIQLVGPSGQSAQLTYDLPAAPTIAELKLATVIRCNRPGVQIAARVVLPRSRNSQTGRRLDILLRGSNISRGLPQETLVLENLPQLLQRQARVERIKSSERIDEREAYVRQLVFLVPGGSGATQISVDQIELYGIVQERLADQNVVQASVESDAGVSQADSPGASAAEHIFPAQGIKQHPHRTSEVYRIIQWQGESFEKLSCLGFNAIWLARTPTFAELDQARALKLALVCPPPSSSLISTQGITPRWDPVLAWDLGELVNAVDLEPVNRLKQLILQHDQIESRTTVMTCNHLTREASRATDAIVLKRSLLGTDLTLRDYVTWLEQRQRLARPGTPIWAAIETEISPLRTQQIAALRGSQDFTSFPAAYDQLMAFASAGMTTRCRDFVFLSHTSLAADDAVTRQRVQNLELLNLRLRLLSPWLATGKVVGTARCTQPGLSAVIFQAERSHLLLPLVGSQNFRAQYGMQIPKSVSFVVPNVTETADVYLLTLTGAKRLRHKRTTGGLEVSAEMLPVDGVILLTSDPQAFSQVSQYLRSIAGQAAKLRRDIAGERLAELAQLSKSMALEGAQDLQQILRRADVELAACDKDLATGFADMAYHRAQAIEHLLSQGEYLVRQSDGSSAVGFDSPLIFSASTLADQRKLSARLASLPRTASLLAGGDFEDLALLISLGWRHQQLSCDGISSAVRLSPVSPFQGNNCLELEVRPTNPQQPIAVIPTAPVWITSAPMSVRQGSLVEISGWVRVSEPLSGSVDGLQIIDSVGGPDMALRITTAPSWQPFHILRGATADTNFTVSIALSGLGKAQVDGLTVQIIEPLGDVADQNAGAELSVK